jgi:hypothetical protein
MAEFNGQKPHRVVVINGVVSHYEQPPGVRFGEEKPAPPTPKPKPPPPPTADDPATDALRRLSGEG